MIQQFLQKLTGGKREVSDLGSFLPSHKKRHEEPMSYLEKQARARLERQNRPETVKKPVRMVEETCWCGKRYTHAFGTFQGACSRAHRKAAKRRSR